MKLIKWQLWICIMLFTVFEDTLSLKNVKLTIEPRIVRRFQHSTLRCSYDLEDSPLYIVKWYRGTNEFYRYTPSEDPSTKVFVYTGINVDEYNSNSTQVVLRDVDFNLSGNFTCEVTKDITFATLSDTQTMLVVQLPDFPPVISVGGEPLDSGDTLRANCTSHPARPPAMLTFVLNDLTVAKSKPLTLRQSQEMAWSDLSLEILLTEFHFSKGRLMLQCIAEISNIYHEEATLELASVRNPVPERVSAVDSANSSVAQIIILQIFICITLLCIS